MIRHTVFSGKTAALSSGSLSFQFPLMTEKLVQVLGEDGLERGDAILKNMGTRKYLEDVLSGKKARKRKEQGEAKESEVRKNNNSEADPPASKASQLTQKQKRVKVSKTCEFLE